MAPFPALDDCNSSADGFTMGGLPIDWVFTTERSTWDVRARHEVSSQNLRFNETLPMKAHTVLKIFGRTNNFARDYGETELKVEKTKQNASYPWKS